MKSYNPIFSAITDSVIPKSSKKVIAVISDNNLCFADKVVIAL